MGQHRQHRLQYGLEGNAAEISVKHRTGGEESYSLLTIQLRREDGQWRAFSIGLEK